MKVFLFLFLSIIFCLSAYSQHIPLRRHSQLLSHADSARYARRFPNLAHRQKATPFAQPDSNLSLVGEWAWGPCEAVQVRGTLAYIGNGKMFQILDISNPANPTLLSEVNAGGEIGAIALHDSVAYVCFGGVAIFDIRDSTKPYIIGSTSDFGGFQMVVHAPYCYVLSIAGGFVQIIDATDPTSPQPRASMITSTERPLCIGANDTLLLVSNWELPILDVYDIARPDTLTYINSASSSSNYSIVTKDTFLFGSVAGTVIVKSIANPAAPYRLTYVVADSSSGPNNS